MVALAGKTLADRLGLAGLHALAIAHAARTQMGIEFGQVFDLGHRRRPVTLQVPHAPFDVRLLLRPPHHAEQRLKCVMTRQRLVAVVELALPAGEDLRRHGARVIPPQLVRHTAEKGERLDQAVQDRLGPLRRQSDGERTVRVTPRHHQHRHLPPAIRKVHVDVPEVGFQSLARFVIQRNERLALAALEAAHITANAIVAAGVTMFVAQATKQLGHRVPLLARRRFVGPENLVDHRLERIDHRRHRSPPVRLGLRLCENLADLPPRVMKPAGQLSDAQLLDRMGPPNARILVHLDHPPPPVVRSPDR